MAVIGDRSRRATALITSLALLGALAACSQEQSGPTLADTKAPTQLLRNAAADLVPAEAVLAVGARTDESLGCGSATDDPDGLKRYWHSGVVLELNSGSSADAMAIGDTLVAAYAGDGWDPSAQQGATSTTTILQNEETRTRLQVVVTPDADGDGLGASIAIDAYGRCVVTAGPESDEVTRLG